MYGCMSFYIQQLAWAITSYILWEEFDATINSDECRMNSKNILNNDALNIIFNK